MAFDLEVNITGICAFVENYNQGKSPSVCVALPSTETDKNALDDEPLCPHQSYIEQGYGFGLIRTPLKKKRVRFVLSGGDNEPIKTPLKTATYDDPGLIDLKTAPIFISGGGALPPPKTDPAVACISKMPSDLVMAQVVLEESYKGEVEYIYTGYWSFDPKDPKGLKVAHEVKITMKNLDGAMAVLEPFDGTRPTSVDLRPPTGIPTVSLRIVNTCSRSVYFDKYLYTRDRDFKWYYQMADNLGPGDLGNIDLPIPRFVQPPLINGNNCFPARLEPVPIQ